MISKEDFTKVIINIHDSLTEADKGEDVDKYDDAMNIVDELWSRLVEDADLSADNARQKGYQAGYTSATLQHITPDELYLRLSR